MRVRIGKYPTHRWYHNWLYDWFGYEQKQPVSVRIDPWDTWSMDHTLAHIIVPMLKQLKETGHGAPHVDNEDVPQNLHAVPKEERDYVVDNNHFKRWNYVLDEMIFAFESKLEDEEGMDKYQERITNGFRLFGKYYEGLWD